MPKTFPTDKARQGRRGFPVLVILVCGMLLVLAVWWGVEIYGEDLDQSQKLELQKSQDEPDTPTGPVGKSRPDERSLPPAD